MSLYFTISGWRRADGWLNLGRYDALLSISDVGCENRPIGRCNKTLLLNLDDTWPGRKESWLPATHDQIATICNFSRIIKDHTMVLCHCGRGRSRSTAAAIIMLIARGIAPEAACKAVFAACPKATPNGWMLHLMEGMFPYHTIRKHCFGRSKGPEVFP